MTEVSNEAVASRSAGVPRHGWLLLLLIAVVGLYIVKWSPYYDKAFAAADHHSIGKSILMGTAAVAPPPSFATALDYATAYGKAIWKALVLGLLLGSAVQVLLPVQWVARAMGTGRGLKAVVAGGVLALPGMMCTCCAAPVVVGLRACRASPGAATAFWLGNTVLNPATLVFTGFVLGWNWTALRLAIGLVMVFGLGWLVDRLAAPGAGVPVPGAADGAAGPGAMAEPGASSVPAGGNVLLRWLRVLMRMSLRLLPEYVLIVLVLGAARAWLFPEVGPGIDNSLLWILAFAAAGLVFVIPTAGEVPIVQAMLALGVGAGPAAALLTTLPPVSAPSLAMVWRSFRPAQIALIVVTILGLALVAAGLAVALGF